MLNGDFARYPLVARSCEVSAHSISLSAVNQTLAHSSATLNCGFLPSSFLCPACFLHAYSLILVKSRTSYEREEEPKLSSLSLTRRDSDCWSTDPLVCLSVRPARSPPAW